MHPQYVNSIDRIVPHHSIQIHPALFSNRIPPQPPPVLRIVVAVAVVAEGGFGVGVFGAEAEGGGFGGGAGGAEGLAEGVVGESGGFYSGGGGG